MREKRDWHPIILCVLLGLMVALVMLAATNYPAYAEACSDHLCDDTGCECVDWADCEHPEGPPNGYTLICPPDIWASEWATELFMPYVLRVEIDQERLEHADYLRVDLWLPYSNAQVYDVLLTDQWTWVHAEMTCIGDNGLRLRFAAQDVRIFQEEN